MKLGARIFKTALAVVLSFYFCEWLGLGSPLFAAIASVLAVQPSLYRSFVYVKEQVLSNLIGALFAIFGIFILGDEPIVIGLIVIIVIVVNISLKAQSSIPLAVVTVVSIMGAEQMDSLHFALSRFYSIMIGILSAVIVNAFFIPPHYEESLLEKMKELHRNLSFLLKNSLNKELEEKVYKKEKKKIEDELKKLQELYELYAEEYTNKLKKVGYSKARKLVVFKQMTKTISSQHHVLEMMERNFTTLSETNSDMKNDIQNQIESLVFYQEKIFFKYEKKLRTNASNDTVDEVSEHNVNLIESTVKHFEKNSDVIMLFPIVSSFIEWSSELDHAEKLIESLHNHHQH